MSCLLPKLQCLYAFYIVKCRFYFHNSWKVIGISRVPLEKLVAQVIEMSGHGVNKVDLSSKTWLHTTNYHAWSLLSGRGCIIPLIVEKLFTSTYTKDELLSVV